VTAVSWIALGIAVLGICFLVGRVCFDAGRKRGVADAASFVADQILPELEAMTKRTEFVGDQIAQYVDEQLARAAGETL